MTYFGSYMQDISFHAASETEIKLFDVTLIPIYRIRKQECDKKGEETDGPCDRWNIAVNSL